MKDDFIYLTYYQVMAFLIKIKQYKSTNPYFNDSITTSFGEFVLQRTYEIANTISPLKSKLFPNAYKYKISKSLYNYLYRLTRIDVFDKETLEKYTILINQLEEMSDEIIKARFHYNDTESNDKNKIHKI